MPKDLNKMIRGFLILGGFYFVTDALVHLFNIKLLSVNDWNSQALVFSKFVSQLFGSAGLLIALLCFEVQRDLGKYQRIITLSAFWAFFYGLFLITSSLQINFVQEFRGMPSVYVWMEYYNFYLILEGLLLLTFSITVFFWRKSRNT